MSIDSEAFAARFLESVPSGVIAIDQTGRIVLMNSTAQRVLGLRSPGRVIGMPCRQVLEACPEVARLLLETLDVRNPPNRAELELRHRQESGSTIGYTMAPIRDPDGQTIGVAMIFKDLTRIERLEEQARLKDRLAVLGQMAAGLAHELRNPLAAIEIHAGLLRRSLDPYAPAFQESLDHIMAEARRLNEAVVTCLNFVRPVEVVERRVLLEPLLESVAVEPSPGARTILRDYQAPGVSALGDETQLRQVFSNLLRNAREAAGSSGTVWVRTRLQAVPASATGDSSEPGEDPTVVIEVADTGRGIPSEDVGRVFLPFFTTKPRGSGLGLALVQKIVESHRGRVDFTSDPGRGTTFRVFLRAERLDGRP